MKIIKINKSFLILNIKKDSVKCFFFYPISLFSWLSSKNELSLSELTIKLVVEVYKDLEKDYDRKYRI
jgi:hypothetical protein